jgi:hypothetical protein
VSESLYTTIEGPKGRADVYEVTQEIEKDAQQSAAGSSRPWDIRYEVRFGGERQSFWAEGEAVTVAKEMAGVPD